MAPFTPSPSGGSGLLPGRTPVNPVRNPSATYSPFGSNNPFSGMGGTGDIIGTGSGTGPQFDQNYLQNLATFAGGLSARPKGGLYLNPTAKNPFEGIGMPLTGGNAPQYGAPWSLLQLAQGNAVTQQTAQPGWSYPP